VFSVRQLEVRTCNCRWTFASSHQRQSSLEGVSRRLAWEWTTIPVHDSSVPPPPASCWGFPHQTEARRLSGPASHHPTSRIFHPAWIWELFLLGSLAKLVWDSDDASSIFMFCRRLVRIGWWRVGGLCGGAGSLIGPRAWLQRGQLHIKWASNGSWSWRGQVVKKAASRWLFRSCGTRPVVLSFTQPSPNSHTISSTASSPSTSQSNHQTSSYRRQLLIKSWSFWGHSLLIEIDSTGAKQS